MTANPLPPDLSKTLDTLSPTELAFLAGYAWAKSQGIAAALPTAQSAAPPSADAAPAKPICIISASQTGNARALGNTLQQSLQNAGIDASHSAAGDYKAKNLSNETILLLITSTQGDGEPPEEALSLYKTLSSKKPPNLQQLQYSVLALGDSSYPQYCQAGKDFDRLLETLGAQRLHPRSDCDLDYQPAAQQWIAEITDLLKSGAPTATAANSASAATATSLYSKTAPYRATLLTRQKITATGAVKNVQHIEIDLEGSGISYQAGDALGVWYRNAPELIAEILELNQLSGKESITLGGETLPLATALAEKLDITVSTPALAQQYAAATGSAALAERLAAPDARDWLQSHPPIILMHDYPKALDAQTLANLFRPLTPRLYSIASSQAEVGEEVHLTVGVVEYQHHERDYTGGASGYLGKTLTEGDSLAVYIEPNPRFRLPADGNTPIIMIGAGTGIAPYRAFMQQRDADGATGDNWLIFGNTKFTDDFLYQAEWLSWRDSGLLTRADLAWSRQDKDKVYVQHKIAAAAAELWDAIDRRGAHIYLCGDAQRMAKDVEAALLSVIAEQGKMNPEDAQNYLDQLRENHRYQKDVY